MAVIKLINLFGAAISGMLLLAITVLMIVQIVLRYIFNSPLEWAEEITIIAFIAMIFFGSVTADHIRITTYIEKFQGMWETIITYTNLLIETFYFSCIIYLFVFYFNYDKLTYTSLTGISYYYLFAVIPISFTLTLVKNWALALQKNKL
jgi:TRAP-type C4-dicarboxylate transport system permease small subunit